MASAGRHTFLIGLGTMVVPFDSSVNVAFPAITKAFEIPIPMIQWVVICYVLTHASLMLAFGRIGDLLRYDLVFKAGLLLSAVAFVLCAAAGVFELLLAARTLQGIGAALVLSCGAALMTSLHPEHRRSAVLGTYAMMFALGSALGPLLGGVLVEFAGWPAVYWFRIPVALFALLLLRDLPVEPRRTSTERFDTIGAVLLATALASALLALTLWSRSGTGAILVPLLAAGALCSLVGFIWWERRARSPLIDLRLFGRRDFSIVNAGNILANLAFFAVMLLVPYYLSRILGLPTVVAGIVLTLSPGGMALASLVGGRIIARAGPDPIAAVGSALIALGLFLVFAATAEPSVALLLTGLLLNGFGAGLYQVACLDIVTGTMPRENRGVAGSLSMLTRTIGVVTGATTLSLAFASHEAGSLAAGLPVDESFIAGFRFAFALATAVAAVVAVAMAVRLGSGRKAFSIAGLRNRRAATKK